MGEERKDECGEDGGYGAASGEAQAVGSAAPGNQRGESDGEKFEEQAELGLRGRGVEAGEKEWACADPVPWLACDMKSVASTADGAGEGCADEREDNDGDGDDGQAAEEAIARRSGNGPGRC